MMTRFVFYGYGLKLKPGKVMIEKKKEREEKKLRSISLFNRKSLYH